MTAASSEMQRALVRRTVRLLLIPRALFGVGDPTSVLVTGPNIDAVRAMADQMSRRLRRPAGCLLVDRELVGKACEELDAASYLDSCITECVREAVDRSAHLVIAEPLGNQERSPLTISILRAARRVPTFVFVGDLGDDSWTDHVVQIRELAVASGPGLLCAATDDGVITLPPVQADSAEVGSVIMAHQSTNDEIRDESPGAHIEPVEPSSPRVAETLETSLAARRKAQIDRIRKQGQS